VASIVNASKPFLMHRRSLKVMLTRQLSRVPRRAVQQSYAVRTARHHLTIERDAKT
jgi:hypothetical protein